MSDRKIDSAVRWARDAENKELRLENNELREALRRMLGVYKQLMPGLRHIAAADYAEINDAPIQAGKLLARK